MKDMTKGNIYRLIISFALPMLIGNVFQQLYNTVDSIVVGQFVGKQALAAVGTGGPIVFFMSTVIMGIAMGASILISQFYGAKDDENVKKTVATTYYVIIGASVIITVLGLIFSDTLLKLMKTPDDVFEMSKTYINIMFLGAIGTFGYNSISAILRGLGDSKTPLYFLILATLINIVLDLFFVIKLGLGVAGVGWATIISQMISFISCMVYLNKTHPVLKIDIFKNKFDKQIFINSMKIGVPSAVQQMTVSIGMIVLQSLVNSFGSSTMAAYNAATKVDMFAVMPIMALNMAVSSFAGQNYGAGEIERVKQGNNSTVVISIIIGVAMSLAIHLWGSNIIEMFINKSEPDFAEIISIGTSYIKIVSMFYWSFSIMMMYSGTLRGVGRAVSPMITSIIAQVVVRIPMAFFLSSKLGSDGIWYAIPSGWVVGLIMATAYYYLSSWRTKSTTLTFVGEAD